jgi:hypothetical protein
MSSRTVIWVSDDRAIGVIIEVLKGNILDHLKGIQQGQIGGRTKDHFMAVCKLQRAAYFPSGLPQSRALDRALQELRKDGKIAFVNRQWELTECEK